MVRTKYFSSPCTNVAVHHSAHFSQDHSSICTIYFAVGSLFFVFLFLNDACNQMLLFFLLMMEHALFYVLIIVYISLLFIMS